MSVELMPCPFCGGEATMMRAWSVYEATCMDDDCPMSGAWIYRTEADAAKAWNTRTPAPAMGKEEDDLVERLRGRALFCRDRGEVKTPELLESAAQALAALQEPQPAPLTAAEYATARGVEVLADRVRELEAETARLRLFIESITDVTGPYPYLDKKQIVADARAVLAQAEPKP